MTDCCHSGCHESDRNDGTELLFEYNREYDNWVPVCERHARPSNPSVPLTDDVKEIPVGTLTMLKDELAE